MATMTGRLPKFEEALRKARRILVRSYKVRNQLPPLKNGRHDSPSQ
jgi:hypothetical protein